MNDLESRVTERELMNELQIRSTHSAHTEEITAIKESFNKEILELEKQRAELIQEKRDMMKNQQCIKNTMSSNLSDLHNLEETFKIELVSKATEFCRLEKDQNEETTRMAKDQDKLQKKHEIELAEFRLQAEFKKKAQGNRYYIFLSHWCPLFSSTYSSPSYLLLQRMLQTILRLTRQMWNVRATNTLLNLKTRSKSQYLK